MRTLLAILCLLPSAFAQVPRVTSINYYGFHKTSVERGATAVGMRVGEEMTRSRAEIEAALTDIPGVVLAHVEAVCCVDGGAALFAGVEERGGAHFALHSAPAGEATLPEAVLQEYQEYLAAVARASQKGGVAAYLGAGHMLIDDSEVLAYQQRFLNYAAANLPLLQRVLRNGSLPSQRAVAATLAGYAADKKPVVDDLQNALQDPDETVRAGAARSLNATAVLAARHPELGLKISPTWFIEMLNSITLSDRLQAAEVLVTLTERDGAGTLAQVRQRALPALTEMARWPSLQHALPSFLLLGRLAGYSDADTQALWEKGDRNSVIEKAAAAGERKPR